MHDGYSSTNGAIPTVVSNLSNHGLFPGMINSSGRAVAWSGGTVTPAPTNSPTVTTPPAAGGNIMISARGAVGGEQIEVRADSTVIGTFTIKRKPPPWEVAHVY